MKFTQDFYRIAYGSYCTATDQKLSKNKVDDDDDELRFNNAPTK